MNDKYLDVLPYDRNETVSAAYQSIGRCPPSQGSRFLTSAPPGGLSGGLGFATSQAVLANKGDLTSPILLLIGLTPSGWSIWTGQSEWTRANSPGVTRLAPPMTASLVDILSVNPHGRSPTGLASTVSLPRWARSGNALTTPSSSRSRLACRSRTVPVARCCLP